MTDEIDDVFPEAFREAFAMCVAGCAATLMSRGYGFILVATPADWDGDGMRPASMASAGISHKEARAMLADVRADKD